MEKYIVNATPVLTWTWLKLNNDFVELESNFTEENAIVKNIPQGITITKADENSLNFPIANSSVFNPLPKKEKDHRRSDGTFIEQDPVKPFETFPEDSHPLLKMINDTAKNAQLITIDGDIKEPLILNINEISASNTVSKQYIYAKENSNATVIFVYNSDGTNQNKTQIIQTKIYAAENATLNIAKVQLTGNKTIHLDDTGFVCGDDAKINFTQIELGGLHIDSGINASLIGNRSVFNSKVSYLCKDKQYIDMNHLVNQYGKRTVCTMDVDGTLKDEAGKAYRGTLDLKKGCAGSKGNEMENTLILSPKALNKSMPNILCTEEDIAAEHGSTIGRLSKEILFYMQTRGIETAEAERIISIAKIKKTLAYIQDEAIKNNVIAFLGEDEE